MGVDKIALKWRTVLLQEIFFERITLVLEMKPGVLMIH